MDGTWRTSAGERPTIAPIGKARSNAGRVDPATIPARAHKTRRPTKTEIKRATKRASRHRNHG